ncbi:MAG: TonB-dependent receptor [Acidobacteriota bacterium]|nr:TonB-dependent receptor [Acidobacteriota bacterium]
MQIQSPPHFARSFGKDAAAFIQDDYKLSPRLTLNLGLRWEYDGMMYDRYGNDTNIWISQLQTVLIPGSSPATGTPVGFVVPANFTGRVAPGVLKSSHDIPTRNNPPRDNFAPRVGFAWQPLDTPRLVIRGAGGFFYDRIAGASIIQSVQLQPPYAADASGGTGAGLAQPFNTLTAGAFPVRWANFTNGSTSNLNEVIMGENFLTPLVYSWNINVQYEFVKDWVLELGSVGSRGIHQITRGWNFNAPYLASAANPVNGITTNRTSNYLVRVPYLGLSENSTVETTNGDFKYNSLQAAVRKRFSKGFTVQAAYTWSRAFTTNNLASGIRTTSASSMA